MLNCKKFSNKIILIHLKLNFTKKSKKKKKKKNHFKMQFNQLHIELHPILPNTFITETIVNVQLCTIYFITTPPCMFSGMLFYMPL